MKIRGFTLIELLIVVAIIGLLAILVVAGVFPAIRDAALNAKCVNNLRQIGIAMSSFASDHDNKIMPRMYEGFFASATHHTWHRNLARLGYVGPNTNEANPDVFYCPSFPPSSSTDSRVKNPKHSQSRYGLRNWGYYSDATKLLPLSQITNPADFFIVADSYSVLDGEDTQGYMISQGFPNWRVHLRHGKKANALFADWHVEAKDRDYFEDLHVRQKTGTPGTDDKPFYIWPEKGDDN